MYILCNIHPPLAQRMGQITISLELRQAVFSFPLKEFLEPHTTDIETYQILVEDFVAPFLHLLEDIVLKDPTSSYIRDHQLGILRSVLMQQIQRYINKDRMAMVLVLFYHLGSHRLVPILKTLPRSYSYSTPFLSVSDFDEGDLLSLSRIRIRNESNSPFRDNIYHDFVRQLLRDPSRTAEYALGPIMHERAALALFKELAKTIPRLPSPFGNNIDIVPVTDYAEDDTYPKLSFDSAYGGHWQWQYQRLEPTKAFNGDDTPELMEGLDCEELYFLLLGYLIFLLPQCGRTDALVAACKDHIRLLDDPFQSDNPFPPEEFFLQYDRFPVRRRLFHEEVNNYLARVSPNIMSGSE
ncbi:hypothetical protein CPC08DRAFT_771773 [Agrocybe pediades]|nr:hypothetical protein CPC08DRAFT_771773 [Agrocybe pediades]